MTGLTQDQLLQALNLHFYNTNAILDHLQIQATTHVTAAATSMAKKYIISLMGLTAIQRIGAYSNDSVKPTFRQMPWPSRMMTTKNGSSNLT